MLRKQLSQIRVPLKVPLTSLALSETNTSSLCDERCFLNNVCRVPDYKIDYSKDRSEDYLHNWSTKLAS